MRAAAVLQATRAALGANAWIFDAPVDGAKVPDYYTVVKDPMDMGTVKRNLESGAYGDATAFLADLRLVWHNCAVYNGPDSDVGRLGARTEAAFERAAAAAGFSLGPRAKRPRATAGVARPRYEPPPPPSSRSGGARSDRGGRPRRAAGAGGAGEMSFDRMSAVGAALGTLEGDALEGALDIVRHALGAAEGGEVELDFDAIGSESLWRLDAYLASLGITTGPPPGEEDGGNGGGGGDDDMSESPSDSDSDSG